MAALQRLNPLVVCSDLDDITDVELVLGEHRGVCRRQAEVWAGLHAEGGVRGWSRHLLEYDGIKRPPACVRGKTRTCMCTC